MFHRLNGRALILVALLALASPAFAAEGVNVRTSVEGGYARILFTWAEPVSYTARIEQGVIVVKFDRPFGIDARGIADDLSDVVSQVRQDADGRTLRFALKRRNVTLFEQQVGPLVALDILPPGFKGQTAALPKPAPILETPPEVTNPDKLEVVKVRSWPHADFSRIVFDFKREVDYTFALQDGKLSIIFAWPMKPDFGRLAMEPMPWVRDPQWSLVGDTLRVDLSVDPSAGLHHFRDGTKIAFDIRAPSGNGRSVSVTAPESKLAPPSISPTAPAVAAQEPIAEPAAPKPEPPRESKPATPPPVGTDAASIAPPKQPDAVPPPSAAETVPSPKEDQRAALAQAKPEVGEEGAAHPPPAAATDAAAAAEAPIATKPETNKAQVQSVTGGVQLSLPFEAPVAGAVFRRGDKLWLVFDRPVTFDLSAIDRRFFSTIERAEQVPSEDATIILLKLGGPVLPTLTESGSKWTLVLGERVKSPSAPILLSRDARAAGPSQVRANLAKPSRVIPVTDPEAGDTLIVVTGDGPAQGLVAQRRFVELALLSSTHGLAVQPLADDLEVKLGTAEAIITAKRGLTLSSGSVPQSPAISDGVRSVEFPGYMDFGRWDISPRNFVKQRQALLQEEGRPEADLLAARFSLARFYLAYGMAPEALGALRLLAQEDESAALDPAFAAARGLANYLLGRLDEAKADLSSEALVDDPHAALWRGLVAAEMEDWASARRNLSQGEKYIGRYPAPWQARLRVASAKAALAVNDVEGVDAALSQLPHDNVPRALALEARLLRGMMLEKLGRNTDALGIYREVANSGYRPLAVRGAFAELDLRNRTGSLSNKDAIEQLERLRFQWRGDASELAVLRKLAALQVAEGDVRNGLLTMRSAVQNFSKLPAARAMADDMAKTFEDLFLNGKADTMPAIQALGLYYDFKELTPVGRLGDDMIRKLADRLISVDLLGQAAELLQHQVDNRLDGVAKASVAARLAVVYLLDRKPQKALNAIRSTRQTLLPDELLFERRLLEARALAELKQYDAALDIIEGMEDERATRLRADIYWASRNWAAAATKLEALLATGWQKAEPLTPDERFDVMRAAVSFSLADDKEGLARLRQTFGPKMTESEDAAAFTVVTESIDRQGVNFRELARRIASVDTLEQFMSSFRKEHGVPEPEPPTN
ncbi:MAG: hypothetical protein HXY22_06230 [Alphaproteobacteria bacterium]|nr:hypothetical protein [Alphaproteobacteria bacterium]